MTAIEQKLPQPFLLRMKQQLGDAFDDYLAAMEKTQKRALRVNTLKIGVDAFLSAANFSLSPTGILPESFFVPDTLAVGRHPLHAAGLFYMQEPSAQMPVSLLDITPGMAVLDLCAAPGGKSGQIAAKLNGRGLLISNEPVPSRANVLMYNLERLGIQNAVVTAMYPEALCEKTIGCFDAVVVDAPCSGEGMFRKDEGAIADWSTAHVTACAARQKHILSYAVQAVKGGGQLLYSTCTFSLEENEEIVDWLLAAYPAFSLVSARHMYPHASAGEGQFAALFHCSEGKNTSLLPTAEKPCAPWLDFCRDYLCQVPKQTAKLLPDGRVLLLPQMLPREWPFLRILRCGVLAGEVKNGRFTPNHALFLALPKDAFLQVVTPDAASLAAFVAGEVIPCDPKLSGWSAVCVGDHPVGFGKAVSGQLKNHYPKGLRLR